MAATSAPIATTTTTTTTWDSTIHGAHGDNYGHGKSTPSPPFHSPKAFSTFPDRDQYSTAHGENDAAVTRNTGLLSPKLSVDGMNGGTHSSNKRSDLPDGDDSKWIHRDKLAKIESQELQAAGIYLPRIRNGRNKRDTSQNSNNRTAVERSRNNSAAAGEPGTPDATVNSAWDLRLPEEIEEDEDTHHWVSINGQGLSKIPVAKSSPAPIPIEHLERDTPLPRRPDYSPTDDGQLPISKLRARSNSNLKTYDSNLTQGGETFGKRSVTEGSPKKGGARKGSIPGKPRGASVGRPGTSGKGVANGNNGATRPMTRGGERDKPAPEGEPPWMISSFRPDPRLPPDQQLLPTVAKRLQQEKWEKEGKAGNIYDRDFRPLTTEGFPMAPPNPDTATLAHENNGSPHDTSLEWPLKPMISNSGGAERSGPASPTRTGSYSTMPKIQDKPLVSPLSSPLASPSGVMSAAGAASAAEAPRVQRVPDNEKANAAAAAAAEKKGCGCCVMM